jgi:hypothetical protein
LEKNVKSLNNKIFEKFLKNKTKNNPKNVKIITLCINKETQIFNRFTMFDEEIAEINALNITRIDNDLIEYLMNEVENIPLRDNIRINIRVKKDMVNKVTAIEKLIKDDVKLKIDLLNKDIKKLQRNSFILALFGMVSIASTQFSQLFENTFAFRELVIVMGWVFMWNAIELFFLDRVKKNRNKIKLVKMYYSECRIVKVIN